MRLLIIVVLTSLLLSGIACQEKTSKQEKAAEAGKAIPSPLVEEIEKAAEDAARKSPRGKMLALEANMHSFQLSLEYFSTMADGYYPLNMETRCYDPDEGRFHIFSELIPAAIQNPYKQGSPPITISRQEPPKWSIDLLGQVIWVPLAKDVATSKHLPDTLAILYKVYGAGPDGFLDLILSSE